MKSKRMIVMLVLLSIVILSFIFLVDNIFSKKTVTGNFVANINYDNNTFSEFDKRNSTLILYNENYLYGKEIADYYANARNISLSRTCGLRMPPGIFMNGSELETARKELLEECICKVFDEMLPASQKPNPCNYSNIDIIANLSPITHLVFTKGMPLRLYRVGWNFDSEMPPADYYLSVLLYSNKKISEITTGSDSEIFDYNYGRKPYRGYRSVIESQPFSSIKGYVRAINISLDRSPAFGRIEAVTAQRTKELIDRTIMAENTGVSGNFLVNTYSSSYLNGSGEERYLFLSQLASNNANFCDEYFNNYSLSWNYSYCRAGATLDGNVAGENYNVYNGALTNNGISTAYNVGLYLGSDAGPNGMQGFDGFYTMLNWKNNASVCTPLCRDLPTQLEQQECRNRSKDFGKEINTDCVGGNPGLIGWQLRSYPLTFYGAWPLGWSPTSGSGGITPEIVTGDAYKDSRYTDNKFARFKSPDYQNNSLCYDQNGNLISCKEKIYFSFEQYRRLFFHTVNDGLNITFNLRYRTDPLNNGKNMGIYFRLAVYNETGSYTFIDGSKTVIFNSNGTRWEQIQITSSLSRNQIMLNGSNLTLDGISVGIANDLNQNMTEFIDFDTIDLIDNNRSESLFGEDIASFNSKVNLQVVYGDYAYNAIDRLGGIGWWGSSSHFLTGGYAYSSSDRFVGAFFSGRTIGESLAYTGNEYSGLVYADPLYSPSGVKIYLYPRIVNYSVPEINTGKPLEKLSDSLYPSYVFANQLENTNATIQINAFHGRARNSTTRWVLSQCNNEEWWCLLNGVWKTVTSGNGSAYGLKLPIRLIDLVNDPYERQNITLKLRVWNVGDEKNDLTNYAYFKYDTNISGNKIIGNISRFRSGSLIMYLDGNANFNQSNEIKGVRAISFIFLGYPVLNFTHDFSLSNLDLTNFDLIVESAPINYVIVKNLYNNINGKIISLRRTSNLTNLCYLDSEVSNLTDLIERCVDIDCPGQVGSVTCAKILNGFKIEGLTHSGVLQHNIPPSNNSSNSSTTSDSSSSGGSGSDTSLTIVNTSSNGIIYPDNSRPQDYVPLENNDEQILEETPAKVNNVGGSGPYFIILLIIITILIVLSIISLIIVSKRKFGNSSDDTTIRMINDYVNQGLYELSKGNVILAKQIYQKINTLYSFNKVNDSNLKNRITLFFNEINKN